MRLLPIACLVLLIVRPCVAADAPATSPDKLIGLWGSERVFGPAAQGTLTIDSRGQGWEAEISGFQVQVDHTQGGVTFSLPGKQGSFQGALGAGGKQITGFWIQAPGVALESSYATPVTLTRSEPGVWQGEVKPLADRVSLYLAVSRDSDGSLQAFIRNPEFNFARRRVYRVTLQGSDVTLENIKRKTDTFHGSYDAEQDVLTLTVQGIASFDFTRRDRDHALGFYPATPDAPYVYRPPVKEDDGWKTTTLAQAGLDPKPLTALVQRIRDQQTPDSSAPYIQSLLVARHGKLALEEYFYGFDRERPHDTRSSGKTLAGALTGIALNQGAKFKLDTPVISLYPQYTDLANPDPRKQKITVQDLLTMDSGLACDDNDDDSPGNEDTMQHQDKQPDWYRYTLDLPMLDEPGDGKAMYCTGGINLLGGILRATTHKQLLEFLQQYYVAPLDIHDYHINLSPDGDAYLGGGIYLRPRDMLKLDQLYLDSGTWHGRRVLSAAWVKASLQVHSTFAANDFGPAHGYGFVWHLHEIQVGGRTYHEYAAEGNGGQFFLMVPELDLAVAMTAGNYGDPRTWTQLVRELLPQYLIPAAGG